MSIFRRRPRPPLLCREVVELVTDYLEGALSKADRERFEAHLAHCPHCSEYLEQMRTTIAAVGRIEPEALSTDAQQDLTALYRRWREE
jgi:anti-sigma factor RsiW